MDDNTGGEVPTPEISSNPSIEFDAPLRTNEQSDSESQANNMSGSVN
jgi:hypothetical protein